MAYMGAPYQKSKEIKTSAQTNLYSGIGTRGGKCTILGVTNMDFSLRKHFDKFVFIILDKARHALDLASFSNVTFMLISLAAAPKWFKEHIPFVDGDMEICAGPSQNIPSYSVLGFRAAYGNACHTSATQWKL